MMADEKAQCMRCGGVVPSMHHLDAKPKRLAGPNHTKRDLDEAGDHGEEFDWLECEGCYGPGFVQVIE